MDTHLLFIDGERRAACSGAVADSLNPATAEPWARVAQGDARDVERAVDAARAAREDGRWSGLPAEQRGEIVARIGELVQEHQDELAMAEIQDSGATLRKAYTADITATAETFQYYGELIASTPVEVEKSWNIPVPSRNLIRREAYGVIGAIVPFNFPLAAAAWKLAPAIAAGNSIVLKPSPYTPITALRLAEICSEAGVPAGVVNVVHGPGVEVGEALVAHEGVDKVAFTGSTRVGRAVMRSCADAPKPVLLELGGKSPNIVLPDAPMETAAGGILFGTFFHSGQVCESGTRVLVHRDQHDDLMDLLLGLAERIALGDPMDPMTTMGPVVSAEQLERIERYVAAGRAAGAEVVFGGERPEHMPAGFFHEPTIFTKARNDMAVAREEIFGPVVVVIPYGDEAEALEIANDSPYGLGAALWSRDVERATRMARRIEAGMVWINDYHLMNPRFPFGGYKRSGFGRELGPEGLETYRQVKHIHVGEPQSLEDKYYFGMTLGEPG